MWYSEVDNLSNRILAYPRAAHYEGGVTGNDLFAMDQILLIRTRLPVLPCVHVGPVPGTRESIVTVLQAIRSIVKN